MIHVDREIHGRNMDPFFFLGNRRGLKKNPERNSPAEP
jgi:hypothetical protein